MRKMKKNYLSFLPLLHCWCLGTQERPQNIYEPESFYALLAPIYLVLVAGRTVPHLLTDLLEPAATSALTVEDVLVGLLGDNSGDSCGVVVGTVAEGEELVVDVVLLLLIVGAVGSVTVDVVVLEERLPALTGEGFRVLLAVSTGEGVGEEDVELNESPAFSRNFFSLSFLSSVEVSVTRSGMLVVFARKPSLGGTIPVFR